MSLKHALKGLVPPALWDLAKDISSKKSFSPRWNDLGFEPLAGVKMFFDPSGAWQKKILEGAYDSFLFKKISDLKPEGKTIYDIGAHIGFHSLYFAKLVGQKGAVASFEPNKANFDRLALNIEENP